MIDVYFIRNNIESDRTDLILSLGDDDKDKFVIGRKFWNEAEFTQQFVFQTNGNMGIGIANPKNKLDVNGTIRAKEVKVESEWADFVFKKGYNLPTITFRTSELQFLSITFSNQTSYLHILIYDLGLGISTTAKQS